SGQPCVLAFSRVLADEEVLVAYNTSTADSRRESVVIDAGLNAPDQTLRFLYGRGGGVPVRSAADGTRFVELDLPPLQFVILRREGVRSGFPSRRRRPGGRQSRCPSAASRSALRLECRAEPKSGHRRDNCPG